MSSGTWSNANTLYVGYSGTGALTVSGGYVSGSSGYIGYNGGSNGTATVTSGTWNTSGILYVGKLGTGALTVNGGYVSDYSSYIGDSGGSNGSVTVTSGTWRTVSSLHVGLSGMGTLTVNGGYVSDSSGYIGFAGNGTATVTSGTWNNGNALYVGQSNTGTLNISGGLVHAGFYTYTGYYGGNGTINLTGSSGNRGVLETGRVIKDTGSGVINFDGGILRALDNQSDFISNYQPGDVTLKGGGAFIDTNGFLFGIGAALSGTGALTKQGAGTLTLSADNSYSGGTTVESGTLVTVNVGTGKSALGTGAVTVGAAGTLAGVGTVLGDTMVAGTLSPGNSPGKMQFGGALSLDSTAVVRMELASLASFDQIAVDGLLTYDGELNITLLGEYAPQVGDTFALFSAASVANSSQFKAITFNIAGFEGSFDYGTGMLKIVAVPEPSMAGLLALGAGLLIFQFKRAVRPKAVRCTARGGFKGFN